MGSDTPAGRKPPHYLGHRGRLRERFRRSGPGALEDYEMVEMLLGYAIPRKDTKPLAKDLLARFGSLRALLDAEAERIEDVPGAGRQASTLIRLVKDLMIRYLEPDIAQAPILNSPEAVRDYLRISIGARHRERFMLLCLDASGRLVRSAVIAEGTVDMAHVYPREVIRTAIEAGAVSLILVHNHPSGALEPSGQDLRLTQELKDLCARLGITLHDHLIAGGSGVYSIALGRTLP